MVHKAKQSLTVLVMKYGSKDIVTAPFESLRKGDVFFVRGESHTVEIDAHYSGDASYDGYLLYDSKIGREHV